MTIAKSKWPQVKDQLILVEKWARDGLTENQIAKNLGIHQSTLEEYKLKHPEIKEALKKGKLPFIAEIENALAKRARGFQHTETKTYIKVENGKGFKIPVIIDLQNVIVCGHTRVKAAQKLGPKTIPCLRADDLTEDQIMS